MCTPRFGSAAKSFRRCNSLIFLQCDFRAFLAILLQSPNPDIVLEGGLLVRQVPQLHRLDDAIHDEGGPKTGSQAKEEHLAAFVTSQSLHGGIVHDLDRAFERSFEIETDPPLS